MFAGKKIVLGVSGGIAAYKIIELASRLKKQGAEVITIMTHSATQFVTPLTFREITGEPVITNMWDEPKKWNVEHIAIAQWADLFVIAPATANIIGKMAHGIADDMLTTVVLATRTPILVVPAMNDQMYLHAAVQENLIKLSQLGYEILDPAIGHMACGTSGPGRLPEPIEIQQAIQNILLANEKKDLVGKKILITAGGTREPIDPVRYIGNRSSGKMGIAIAQAAKKRGAEVHLVAGITSVPLPQNICISSVETTLEMQEAVLKDFDSCDIVIKAAAVADYRVESPKNSKIKKHDGPPEIRLVENPDILKELGKRKKEQFIVGFAAETDNLIANAQKKLISKNIDMIVANDVSKKESSFNSDTNQIQILTKDGAEITLPTLSKIEVANQILDEIVNRQKKN